LSAASTGNDPDRAAPPADHRADNIEAIAPPDDGERLPMGLNRDASDQTFDRRLAYLELLDSATSLFREGASVSAC
jgi:hypothetical protein